MARTLEFIHDGQKIVCGIEKVDRAKLYGGVSVETRDGEGRPCHLMTLAGDGQSLIPSGGTAFAYVSEDGRWLERSDLKPVDIDGRLLNPVSSSFSQPIELDIRTSVDRFLDHSVRLVYALQPADGATLPQALTRTLDDGAIFKIDFSYRGGVSADPAFVMAGADGAPWLLVCDENNIDYVTLEQMAGLVAEEDEASEADDIDFEMM